jgi:hypothetical protein
LGTGSILFLEVFDRRWLRRPEGPVERPAFEGRAAASDATLNDRLFSGIS